MRKLFLYTSAILTLLTFIFYGIDGAEASPVVTNHFQNEGCADINRTLILTDPPIQGEDILELQERLVELGYPAPTNGIYDEQTARIIKSFKAANNLEANTEVGPLTWEKLGRGVHPSTSTKKPGKPEQPVQLLIEVTKQQLTVYSGNKVFLTFKVAVGKHHTPTPHGEFKIVSKGAWGGGFGAKWNGLNVPWGTFGVHGTNKPWSIGRYASHGCIRMFNEDVETLFAWAPIGTPVKIINKNLQPPQKISRTLKPKTSGQSVVFAQEALKNKRFLLGMADGIYGVNTAIAVSYFQAFNNLPVTGEIDLETYEVLMSKEQ